VTAGDPLLVEIRDLVEAVAGPRRVPSHVGPETRLSEGGFWLDSIELLQVVVACEERFAIVFDPTRELTASALETLESLSALIRTKGARISGAP
jgi:acyl carrier protein